MLTLNRLLLYILLLLIISNVKAQQLWSDATTWPGGIKPQAMQNVTIPMGTTIILDEDPPVLGGITILGTLEFARKNTNLTCAWMMVHGTLQIGTPQQPFTHKAIITLNGEVNENVMGMGSRGIMVMGGKLELHGATEGLQWTKINQHATAGSTQISLLQSLNLQPGDELAIAPTDYYLAGNGSSVTQLLTVTSVNGSLVQFQQPLNAHRWGRLQYATTNGMSLDSVNIVPSPVPDTDNRRTPKVLDERAPVGKLTRNITIQAPNDALWQNQGFGAHIMIMGTGAEAHVSGIEIKRGGQRNRLGRYPFHWHMLSYVGSATLADATGQYFRNSSINQSTNRGIVIHGTNGVSVENNVVYNVLGHGIFTEDAVERRNIIDSNLVMLIRNTTPTNLPILKIHEGNSSDVFGSSGFWISNPDNTLTNNIAADCNGFGFWLAFTTQPWGESINVLHTDGLLLNPSRLQFGVFDNNMASSNRNRGVMLDLVENSNEGTVVDNQYWSTTNGRQPVWPNPTLRRFSLARVKVWKNGMSGIWDRAVWPDNFEIVSADNCGRFFAGSGDGGIIENSLVIGTSLNHLMNGTNRPLLDDAAGGNQTPAAFATYHSGFDMRNNIIINFPLVANTRSGAFATEDYYLRPVDKGPVRNTNNILINSHIGVKLPARFPYFALAGALWDPNGLWSSQADTLNYFVYNTPYFTFNEQVETVSPGAAAGGVIVKGPFYGFNDFEINRANDPQADLMALKVDRLNVSLDSVGNWTVQQAASASDLLAHMRHFATKRGGFYRLSFPTIAQVNDIAFTVENMLSMADSVVIGIEFNGSTSVEQVYISSFPNFMAAAHASWPTSFYNNPSAGSKHVFQAVNSMSALLNNTGMGAFWQDRTQNLVWIKLKGGLPMMWNEQQYEPFSEQRLYRKFGFRIVGNNATTWHGNSSNQWENVQNWTNGLPDNTKDAIIPQALRIPILSNPTTIRSLTIDSAASLTLNATLTIQRNLTNFGVISGQGNTLMQGAGSIFNKQVLAGSGVVNNLTIQNAEGVEIVNTQGVLFGVNGRLQILSGSLITNNQLLLASNTQNDAQVGAINGSISGQVVYEKFIPQGRRAYRDLAIPVANAGSFFQNWQANGLNGILGTTITGAASPTAGVHPITGLDYTITGNNSLFQFQQATWQPITNTRLTSSIPYAGYRLLVRGNRLVNMYQVPQPIVTNGPTILRTQGNIISGNVTLTTTGVQSPFPHSFSLTPGSGQFNFIANPYASIIDWHSVYQRSSNISANYWYLDPTFGLANRSVYVSYNALSGTNSNPLASQVGRYIQSGQAFFTQNSSNNAPVIRFTEADKSPDFINKGIFDVSATQIPAVQLAIQKNDTIVDGTVALFSANFNNAIGAEDAIKLVNEHENMAFRAGGENLSIQARQHPDTLTALPLLFWQLKPNEHYQLAIKKQYFPNNSVQPFLHNSHTKQTIPITNETTFINLPTVQHINDTLKNLSIVFRQPTVLANTLLQLSMLQTSNSQQLVWQLTTNETVKHFEVLYAAENNEFSSIHITKFIPNIFQYIHQQTSFPKGFYKIKLIHISGEISYSNTVYHAQATTKINFTIMPNPVVDNQPLIIAYTSIHNQKLVAQITNALGQIVYTTSLDVQANSGKWYIQQNLPKGTYRLTIFSDNSHLLESLKFIKQ